MYEKPCSGQPHPPPGPLGARFRALGGLELGPGRLGAGPWGDCSSDLHILLKQFAELLCAGLKAGKEVPRVCWEK